MSVRGSLSHCLSPVARTGRTTLIFPNHLGRDLAMRLSRLQIPAVLAVGGILGYFCEQGGGPRFTEAIAAPRPIAVMSDIRAPRPPDAPINNAAAKIRPACCSSGAQRGTLLAALQEQQVVPQHKAKPNILVIFGDDIGITNVSCYSDGLMGYETPNIDRIAKEGLRFLHYYAEQ